MNVPPIERPEQQDIFGIPTFKGLVSVDDLRAKIIWTINSGLIDGDKTRSSIGHAWRSDLMLHQAGHAESLPAIDDLVTRVRLFCTSAGGRMFMIDECWLNALHCNAYNSVHDHYPHEWSGVLWIDAEHETEETFPAGCLEFISPFPNRAHSGDGNLYVKPINGAAVLFPASLKHMVHPTRSQRTRISFAWNGRFVGGRIT